MRSDLGRDEVVYIHVTLLPYLGKAGELKTKPTQHSVKELRSIGIQPDVLVCRTAYEISRDMRDKLALFCDVEKRAVITCKDMDSIYEIPRHLAEQGMDRFVMERLRLSGAPCNFKPGMR
jgi:CTP synthase